MMLKTNSGRSSSELWIWNRYWWYLLRKPRYHTRLPSLLLWNIYQFSSRLLSDYENHIWSISYVSVTVASTCTDSSLGRSKVPTTNVMIIIIQYLFYLRDILHVRGSQCVLQYGHRSGVSHTYGSIHCWTSFVVNCSFVKHLWVADQ